MKMVFLRAWLGCLLWMASADVRADFLTLPPSLAPDVLSETVPFTFTPNPMSAADYRIEWVGAPLAGVRPSLNPGSLDWVRVLKHLDIPRAVLTVEVDASSAPLLEQGRVTHAGYTQVFRKENGAYRVDIPVALISGDENPIEITVQRADTVQTGKLRLRFAPRPEVTDRIVRDSTCSKYDVEVVSRGSAKDDWIYVACRYVWTHASPHAVPSFEIYVFWDNVGQTIRVDGVQTESASVSVWPLRLRPDPGRVKLQAKNGHEIEISYRVPSRHRRAFVGLGLGAYHYLFENEATPADDTHTWAPMPTLYGAFDLHESMRIVAFGMGVIPLQVPSWYGKLGLYLWTEQMNVFDSRFSMNVLLGAHVLTFHANGNTYARLGGPQGIEFIFRDFILRGHDVMFGGFAAPPLVTRSSYYNVYLRWGKGRLFGELNYVSWREAVHSDYVYSRSLGVSVGIPFAHLRFW